PSALRLTAVSDSPLGASFHSSLLSGFQLPPSYLQTVTNASVPTRVRAALPSAEVDAPTIAWWGAPGADSVGRPSRGQPVAGSARLARSQTRGVRSSPLEPRCPPFSPRKVSGRAGRVCPSGGRHSFFWSRFQTRNVPLSKKRTPLSVSAP